MSPFRLVSCLILFLSAAGVSAAPAPAALYDFKIERMEIPVRGARLAATVYRPVQVQPGETFPALLEFLPYRKDDSFYLRDHPLYSWLARHGYLAVKVDVRGTGSSTGTLPAREYSETELADAVAVIGKLAKLPGSNGKVGMWGISWGAINSLQVALRRPPHLAAILVLHPSDDLFHDDVHYIDGALHLDQYALEIDHENGLPRPPGYPLDAAYFADRFDREPWLFTYLRHPQDGDFWRRESPRFRPGLEVPVMIIGGLLDGYRDSVARVLESAKGPVRAAIGPWGHDWPDNGTPGPNYEWRLEAVRWWDCWLKGKETGILEGPRLLLFVRAGSPPDPHLAQTPGEWRQVDWPIPGATVKRLFPVSGNGLQDAPGEPAIDSLRYQPGLGSAAGLWWGDPTGDQRADDAGSLVFAGPPLTAPLAIAGFPRVTLRAAADAPLAHWVARLEDVQPDGSVSLVTGAVLNGAQRESRLAPRPQVPGEVMDLSFDLHFTTWTFQPGHRIRLAVSNAQFPMIWPTPHPMTSGLHLGPGTHLDLPVLPPGAGRVPDLPSPQPREQRADARNLPGGGWPAVYKIDRSEPGVTRALWEGESLFEVQDRRFRITEKLAWDTRDADPARSGFSGEETTHLDLPQGRTLDLRTRIELRSDAAAFHLVIRRELRENGRPVRERTWREAIPRRMQ
jgi:predicted acyl esterase